MNRKKILILSGVLVLLIALLIVITNLPDKTETNPGNEVVNSDGTPMEQSAYTVNYDSISSITLYSQDGTYEFVKNDMDWSCQSHPEEEFNMTKISSLSVRLSAVSCVDTIPNSASKAADFGIDINSPDISFICDKGNINLYCGDISVSGEGYYFLTSMSDDVYIISATEYKALFAPVSQYRKDNVNSVDYDKISSIEFRNENCAFSLRLGEADVNAGIPYAWTMTAPIQAMARDAEISERIINPLVERFETPYVSELGDYENYGINRDENYIIITDADGNSQTAYFGPEIGGKCYMCVDDSRFIYEQGSDGDTYAKIQLIDIISRNLYMTHQSKLSKVTIEGDGIDFVVDFTHSSGISVNGKAITDSVSRNDIFNSVCALLADDISTDPIGEAEMTITYDLKDSQDVVLEFAEMDARYWRVAVDGKPTYIILKSKVDANMEKLKNYSK